MEDTMKKIDEIEKTVKETLKILEEYNSNINNLLDHFKKGE